jgi:hypothetical protein
MGRIIRPVRIRPEKPLSAVISSASTAGKKDGKKKREREKLELVRARRRTIDPTKWDSQHLNGAFLESIVVADHGDNMPVTAPSQSDTAGDQGESNLLSGEEGGDESDSSEPVSVVGEPPSTPKGVNRPLLIDHTKGDTVETDCDFNFPLSPPICLKTFNLRSIPWVMPRRLPRRFTPHNPIPQGVAHPGSQNPTTPTPCP